MIPRGASRLPLLGPLLVGLLALPVTARPAGDAAPPHPEPGPLTLEQAIQTALARNEVPSIARARIEGASAIARGSFARLLPFVVLEGSYTRRQRGVERDVGGTTAVIQSENALGLVGVAEISLLDAPAIPLVMSAYASEEATRLEAEELTRQLASSVAASFFAVLSAEELLLVAERRVSVAGTAVEVARRRLLAGLANQNEVTRTSLALSTARLARNDAALLVRTSRLTLENLLADDSIGALAAPADESDSFGSHEVDPSGHPAVQALVERARAEDLRSVEPWLRLLPTLGAGAQMRATNEPGISGQVAQWALFGTASWVLYDGGLRYADARARAAEAEELRLTAEARKRQVSLDHSQAFARLEASRAALEEARESAALAAANAEEVERMFAAGLATALEIADATAEAYEAAAAVARAGFALRLAGLEQRRSLGLWPTDRSAPQGDLP